jgi:hypothetical protein
MNGALPEKTELAQVINTIIGRNQYAKHKGRYGQNKNTAMPNRATGRTSGGNFGRL